MRALRTRAVKPTPIPFESADLHFRGFSETRIDPQRKQPDTFFYDRVSPVSFWNPTPGLYTRFGAVDNLLRDVDDQLVIMGSGDEVTLRFPVAALQAPGSRMDPRLPAQGGRLGQGSRSEHRLLFHGSAASVPWNVAVSLSGERTLPARRRARFLSAHLQHPARASVTRPLDAK